jgi:hypothetical protein
MSVPEALTTGVMIPANCVLLSNLPKTVPIVINFCTCTSKLFNHRGFTTIYISVPITNDVVSSNLDQGEVYNIVIKFVSDRSMVFSGSSGFCHQ